MSNIARQNRDKGRSTLTFQCLSLFLALAVAIGSFVYLTHRHGDLYSRRACMICLNEAHLNGEIMEVSGELPELIVSYVSPEVVPEITGFDEIPSNSIRAPPFI